MKTVNTNVHARFFGLAKALNITDRRHLVWHSSNMLTDSLTVFLEKNPTGYYQMVANLQKMADNMKNKPKTTPATGREVSPEVRALRSRILKRLQMYGVETWDMNRVNAFMEQPRIAGKRLYHMSIPEMENLLKGLHSILGKEAKKQAEINRLSKQN